MYICIYIYIYIYTIESIIGPNRDGSDELRVTSEPEVNLTRVLNRGTPQ